MYCLRLDSATFMNVSQRAFVRMRNRGKWNSQTNCLFCSETGFHFVLFMVCRMQFLQFFIHVILFYTCRHVCLPSKCKFFFSLDFNGNLVIGSSAIPNTNFKFYSKIAMIFFWKSTFAIHSLLGTMSPWNLNESQHRIQIISWSFEQSTMIWYSAFGIGVWFGYVCFIIGILVVVTCAFVCFFPMNIYAVIQNLWKSRA